MFPTGLPSIARLKAKFDPKFAGLRTIKRPAGRARRAAAVSIEAAQRKTRARKSLVTDVNLDFMTSCYLGIRFWPALRVHHQTLPIFEIALVLAHLDHVASFIVNANHGIG
jgi:hypothetical protein